MERRAIFKLLVSDRCHYQPNVWIAGRGRCARPCTGRRAADTDRGIRRAARDEEQFPVGIRAVGAHDSSVPEPRTTLFLSIDTDDWRVVIPDEPPSLY
jgi:hypothetical protein